FDDDDDDMVCFNLGEHLVNRGGGSVVMVKVDDGSEPWLRWGRDENGRKSLKPERTKMSLT
ncbi:hypothetical protein M8C21_012534, partial [Ambrosia artemisiifolia]